MIYHMAFSQVLDGNGDPIAGATLTFSVTGTTTPQDSYSDAANASANTNPLVADDEGRFGGIYLSERLYKVVLADALGNIIWTEDPACKPIVVVRAAALPSVNWPFMRVYNTGDGHVYERKSDDSGWTDLGPVDSVGNTATVADVLAGTDASKFVTADSLAGLWEAGTAVSIVTNNISLPSTGGGVFTCGTATTTLTTISSSKEGREIEIIFTSAQTITHGSGINTLGGLTYTIPAGTRVRFRRGATDWSITRQALMTAPGQLAYIGTQRITATGTYTRSKGCVWAFVRTVGPGGGGASSDTGTAANGSGGGGGGGGGYCEEWVTPGVTESVTIGTAGATQSTAATAGNNGSGASSFGSFHSAAAGQGGAAMSNGTAGAATAGGTGGAATNGGLNISGTQGGYSYRAGGGAGHSIAGSGGSNPLGMGGNSVASPTTTAVNGKVGTGYGAGGGGGAVNGNVAAATGAAGTDGICLIDEYGAV